MEQSSMKKILNALILHSEHIDKKMTEMKVDLENWMDESFKQVDLRFEQVDRRFEQIDKRFNNLGKKVDGIRVDLSETQDTTDFLSNKVIQYERKIRTTN